MEIPAVIKQQAEEANKLHRKMYPEQYGDTPLVEVAEVQKEVTPEPEGTPTPEGEAPATQATETEPEGQPIEEPKPEPEPVVAVEAPDLTSLQTAYQKLLKTHEIMKNKYELGKHNEEYKAALDARDNRIANLEAEMARREVPVAPASIPTIEVTPELQSVFEEIKTDVGEDTANKLAKYFNMVAVQAAQKAIAPVGQDINSFRQEIDSVKTTTRRQMDTNYVEDLTVLCPDWQTIMVDPGFIDYLNEVDIGSGKSRFDLAREGEESLDAERVAHWYNGYKRDIGLLTEAPVKTVTSKVNPPKKGKESLIAPVSSAKGVVREPEKPYYSQANLKETAQKIIQLNQAGRLEDANKLAKDRDLAIAERRVLP